MKKEFIRIYCRNKKHDITLPFEMAEKILQSKDQLVMIYDKVGKWTGITINKAEIVSTDHDFENELQSNRENNPEKLIEEHQITDEERKRISKKLEEIKNKFKI